MEVFFPSLFSFSWVPVIFVLIYKSSLCKEDIFHCHMCCKYKFFPPLTFLPYIFLTFSMHPSKVLCGQIFPFVVSETCPRPRLYKYQYFILVFWACDFLNIELFNSIQNLFSYMVWAIGKILNCLPLSAAIWIQLSLSGPLWEMTTKLVYSISPLNVHMKRYGYKWKTQETPVMNLAILDDSSQWTQLFFLTTTLFPHNKRKQGL